MSTCGLAAIDVWSDHPLPLTPIDATRSLSLAPKTRARLAAVHATGSGRHGGSVQEATTGNVLEHDETHLTGAGGGFEVRRVEQGGRSRTVWQSVHGRR